VTLGGFERWTVLSCEVPDAGMKQPEFLGRHDRPTAMLETARSGNDYYRLKGRKQPLVRVDPELSGDVQDDGEIGGLIAFGKALRK